jgi:hypothetical protein
MFQISKNIVLQWGELPTSVAYIGTGQIMGWGNKVRYTTNYLPVREKWAIIGKGDSHGPIV